MTTSLHFLASYETQDLEYNEHDHAFALDLLRPIPAENAGVAESGLSFEFRSQSEQVFAQLAAIVHGSVLSLPMHMRAKWPEWSCSSRSAKELMRSRLYPKYPLVLLVSEGP